MTQESLGALLLSPRSVAVGSPAGAALENVNTAVLGDGALCYVTTGAGKGEWQLDKSSTETADGVTVVAPIAGPGRWLKAGASAIFAGTADIWVDVVNGVDTNPGTQAAPVQTLDAAKRLLNYYVKGNFFVRTHLVADPDLTALGEVTVYSGDEFWDDIYQSGKVQYTGDDQFIELSPPIALTSNPAPSGLVLDFSAAAPGWTIGQWAGHTLDTVSSSAGIPVGQKRFILYNTADTLYMSYVPTSYPDENFPNPGDVFRIGTAAVGISVAPGTDNVARSLAGSVDMGTDATTFYGPLGNYLGFRNLELYFPSTFSGRFFMQGRLDFTGCCVSQEGTDFCNMVLEYAIVTAGKYVLPSFQGVDGENLYGWGLAFRSRDGNFGVGEPRLTTRWSKMAEVYLAGGTWECANSTYGTCASHGFSSGLTSCLISAGLYGLSCEMYFFSGFNYMCRGSAANQRDVMPDCPGTWFLVRDFRHLGTGAFFLARYKSEMDMQNPILYLGGTTPLIATGLENNAHLGAGVNIVGDNTNLGDVSAGVNAGALVKDTRPSAAWVAGDEVHDLFGSFVGRLA